jgi:antitoxin ChpS
MNTATLRAVGGSVTVTLPRQMLRQMGLEAGHEVEITTDGRSLTLAPARKRYSLARMLKGMKPGDMPAAAGWDVDPPAGREAW